MVPVERGRVFVRRYTSLRVTLKDGRQLVVGQFEWEISDIVNVIEQWEAAQRDA